MLAFNFFGATEGGLFDINATLPLMAIQVVALTYILNSLFFKPVGNVVEKREKFVSNNIIDCLLYTSPSPRDKRLSRMPSSA